MTDPDYEDLLWELAARLSSQMTPHEIRQWLIDTGKYGSLAAMSDDDLTAEIETWYLELAKTCDVKVN